MISNNNIIKIIFLLFFSLFLLLFWREVVRVDRVGRRAGYSMEDYKRSTWRRGRSTNHAVRSKASKRQCEEEEEVGIVRCATGNLQDQARQR